MQDGAGGSALKPPLLLFTSHLTPPKCTQVCLNLGLYVCICNGVCCVSQGLSWLYHQRTAGLWDAPCVGTSVGKENCLSQCRETAVGRVFWLQSQELQLSLLLRTHSSADSGGLASTQAGYQQDHHGTTFEQTAALTSRCDIQVRSLHQLEWLVFFLKTFCLLSRRLLQFRVQSFKCCLAHFPLLSLMSETFLHFLFVAQE